MTNLSQFTGKVYPDRSFSIGRIPREKKKTAEKVYDRDYTQQFDSVTKINKSYRGVEIEHIEWLDGVAHSRKFNKSPKLSQKRGKYGGNGITGFGRRVVKNGAILLERKYGVGRLGFVTATIPNFDSETIRMVSTNWALVVKRFFQKIKRHLEKKVQPLEIVCCSEIQEKRFRKYGDVAPHLHFIYVCKTRAHEKKFSIIAHTLRRYWRESMSQVIELKGGKVNTQVSFNSSINAQVIKKSAANYLGKYMSKGGKIIEELQEKGLADHLPSQWWTASKLMKKMFRESIIKLDNNACNFIFYNLGDCLADGWLDWCSFVEI